MKSASFLFAALLLCAPLGAATSRHRTTIHPARPDLRGIYVYTNDVASLANAMVDKVKSSFNVTGVDGIALAIGWNAIEPSMGQYQWTLLDQWMAQALASGKKVDLVLLGGSSTPAWLFQAPPAGAGVKALTFTISPHSGATGLCQPDTIAAPWDPTYLAQWDAFLGAVAAHLRTMKTYDAVSYLRLTGIERTTDELRLPAESAKSTGLACVSDAPATWQQAGYKPSLLLKGWDALTTSFAKNFPDKLFSVAIIPVNPFPAIAEDGTLIKGTPPDENQPLIALAAQKFPGRLVVQFDFLMPGEAASPAVTGYAQTLGTIPAFQTNEYFGQTGGGAACSEPVTNPTPCTSATYMTLLQTGIYPLGPLNRMRAEYIEVFAANALAFPEDVQQAHLALTAP